MWKPAFFSGRLEPEHRDLPQGKRKACGGGEGRKGSGTLRKVDIIDVMSSGEREGWLALALMGFQGL